MRNLLVLTGLLLALGQPASANIAPRLAGTLQAGTVMPNPPPAEAVIDIETLTIDFAEPVQASTSPEAKVVAEYVVRNPTDHTLIMPISFPFTGSLVRSTYDPLGRTEDALKFQQDLVVTLDDRPLKHVVKTIDIPDPSRPVPGMPFAFIDATGTAQFCASDNVSIELFKGWLLDNPDLASIATTYFESDVDYSETWQSFEKEAKTALTELGDVSDVWLYLENPGDWIRLRRLLLQANPAYRKDAGNGFWTNRLPEQLPAAGQLADYQTEIHRWLNSHPTIELTFKEYKAQRVKHDEARQVLKQKLNAALANHKLSDDARNAMFEVFSHAFAKSSRPRKVPNQPMPQPVVAPSVLLMGQLDPKIAERRLQIAKVADDMIKYYGFDEEYVSPLTGKPYSFVCGMFDDSCWSVLNHDFAQEAKKIGLGIEKATVPLSHANQIEFEVSLAPGEKHTLRVGYTAQMEGVTLRAYDVGNNARFRYILNTARHWKSFGPIHVSVTMPQKYHAVIYPQAGAPKIENDKRVFEWEINQPKENLKIALVSDKKIKDWASEISEKAEYRQLAEKILPIVSNPEAKEILRRVLGLAEKSK